MHQNMMYPPRIEMTVQLLKENSAVTVSMLFDGCVPGERALEELQFAFPLGISYYYYNSLHLEKLPISQLPPSPNLPLLKEYA